MPEQYPPLELSVKSFHVKKPSKNKLLRLQTSKPPKNAVKIKPVRISVHFLWALVLTITCFFVIGPCWALYKTREIRRLIEQNELDKASRLSSKVSSTLVISTIIGVFAWMSFLFCSVGLLITGMLIDKHAI